MRKNYTKDVDWGYYYMNYHEDGCIRCKDMCTNDANCAGVECDPLARYCLWWKQGKCVTSLWANNSQTFVATSYETCIKLINAGE